MVAFNEAANPFVTYSPNVGISQTPAARHPTDAPSVFRPYNFPIDAPAGSFMPSDQSIRDLVARMKLIPNKSLIREKRIAFFDDSIVRGTQLKDNAQILLGYGAKEIHIRISCPPLIYPCKFLNFGLIIFINYY